MSANMRRMRLVTAILLGAVFSAACQPQPEIEPDQATQPVTETIVAATAVPQSSPVLPPENGLGKRLVVCTIHEPVTLYRHEANSLVEEALLHAIYENDVTYLDYEYQAQGLIKIPTLADGDVRLQSVKAQAGDKVVDVYGRIQRLAPGVEVMNSAGEIAAFDGAPLLMRQMLVDFSMKPRFWSDGTAVTAEDSVFSYRMDAAANRSDYKIQRTAAYEATGDLTTRWTGIPGFIDAAYPANFWGPLPRHLLGRYQPEELPLLVESARLPVGDGPFRITEWLPGQSIHLEPNPFYYRRDEGLPFLDSVTFRFLPDTNSIVNQLLSGDCDVGMQSSVSAADTPLFLDMAANGLLTPYFQPGTVYEHIDFGVNSWGQYGDGYGRPDWFEDARVRQAIAMCTDRQRMADELVYGRSPLLSTFIPPGHPLYAPEAITAWPYDPVAANALLDEAGYKDENEDGLREDPKTGRPFAITIGAAAGSDMRLKLFQIFSENMRDCGLEVTSRFYLPSEWYGDSDSPLFGRRFDLAEFEWPVGNPPLCYLYASWQITGPANELNPDTGRPYGGWDGLNDTGWWDTVYDEACLSAINTLPGTGQYNNNYFETQRFFSQNLPAIPLFLRLKVALTRPEVQNFNLNSTQNSEFWNFYEIDVQN